MLSPYPWRLEEGRYIRDQQNRKIASCAYARHTISFKVTEDQRRSNAEAMTLAPELIALVVKLAGTGYDPGYKAIADLIDEARQINQRLVKGSIL